MINLLVSLLGDKYGQPSNQLVSLYSSRNCDLFSTQRRPSCLYKFNSSGETIIKGSKGIEDTTLHGLPGLESPGIPKISLHDDLSE